MSDVAATSDRDLASASDRVGIWALAAANGISQAGNSMTALAVPWFVLITTGSASRTGVAGAVVALSPVAAGLIAGPIVDRLGFRRSSIVSDALSGITVALIPTLFLLDWLSFGQLLVLIFLGAFFDVPGHTARSALIPSLARRAGMPLERANSIMQLSFSLSNSVIAPLIAGVLIGLLGAAQVLYVDAGTFAVSILLIAFLVRIRPGRDHEAATDGLEGVGGIFAGFRFVFRDRVTRAVLPVAILLNGVGSAYGGVLLPVYVRDEFDNPAYLGLLFGAMGGGILLGILLFGAYGDRLSRYNTFLIGFSVSAAAIWLFTVSVFLPTDLIAMFVFGFGMGPANPLLHTLLHIRTPEEMLGRVLSALYALGALAAPLGVLLAGFSIDALGRHPTMITAAALTTLAPLWVAFSPWSRAAAPAFEE